MCACVVGRAAGVFIRHTIDVDDGRRQGRKAGREEGKEAGREEGRGGGRQEGKAGKGGKPVASRASKLASKQA